MTPRVARLRKESFEAQPGISVERAVLVTQFYKKNYGKYSMAVLRALNFKNVWLALDGLGQIINTFSYGNQISGYFSSMVGHNRIMISP